MYMGAKNDSMVSIYYDVTFLKYLGRKVQDMKAITVPTKSASR